jgi:hypothetical protein
MTFLTKRDENVRAETLAMLVKLCSNQDIVNALMKEQNFHYIIEQSQFNPSEEVRSLSFKLLGCLSTN